jgi:hypothetical protein
VSEHPVLPSLRLPSLLAGQHFSTSPVPGDLSAFQLVGFRMRGSLLTC